ncbi:MAG: lysylphosphatidylglycerol synthase transmembrane domain-containing protein [Pseudomonadota bacterium]
MATSMRSILRGVKGRKAVRLVVSILLIAALSYLIDWPNVLSIAVTASWEWLLAAIACVLAARACITLRWSLLLRVGGDRWPFWRLFGIVSAGIGLGSLLPTSVGPDVTRGYLLHSERRGDRSTTGTAVVSSLLLDRYMATMGTLLVGIGGAFAVGQTMIGLFLLAALIGVAGVTALLLSSAGALIKAITPGALAKLRPKLEAVLAALRAPGMLWRGAAPAIVSSTAMTLFRTGAFVCVYHALGYPVPLALACFAIPLMLIALMAPVTIGGFGVREWLLVIGFESAGVPPEVSVSVGILFFALQILVSLPAVAQTLSQRWRADRPVAADATKSTE